MTLPDATKIDQVPIGCLCKEANIYRFAMEHHGGLIIEKAYLRFNLHSDRLPDFHVLDW